MFDDKKFGVIFPTRTGTPSGTSNERIMLDKFGGSDGFRTQYQSNGDGSVTMLRTKNGMPQFSTVGTTNNSTTPMIARKPTSSAMRVIQLVLPNSRSFQPSV